MPRRISTEEIKRLRATGAEVKVNPRTIEVKDFNALLDRLDSIERNQLEATAGVLKAIMAMTAAMQGGKMNNTPLLDAIKRLEKALEPTEYRFKIDRETTGFAKEIRAVPVRSKRDG